MIKIFTFTVKHKIENQNKIELKIHKTIILNNIKKSLYKNQITLLKYIIITLLLL
jgi:hypothetical protein